MPNFDVRVSYRVADEEESRDLGWITVAADSREKVLAAVQAHIEAEDQGVAVIGVLVDEVIQLRPMTAGGQAIPGRMAPRSAQRPAYKCGVCMLPGHQDRDCPDLDYMGAGIRDW